jgi:hypothetical protein
VVGEAGSYGKLLLLLLLALTLFYRLHLSLWFLAQSGSCLHGQGRLLRHKRAGQPQLCRRARPSLSSPTPGRQHTSSHAHAPCHAHHASQHCAMQCSALRQCGRSPTSRQPSGPSAPLASLAISASKSCKRRRWSRGAHRRQRADRRKQASGRAA